MPATAMRQEFNTGTASVGLLDAAVSKIVSDGKLPVPPLPGVASQLLAAVGDDNTDAAQLAGLVHRDPSLAGQVLRIANSPSYQPRTPIVSLQQAVARLGTTVLREIAVAASLQSGVFKVPGFEAELATMWRHALATAAFAKEVARVRRMNVESAFLCGLLARIGCPVLLQTSIDEAKRIGLLAGAAETRTSILQAAETYATPAGTAVGTAWKLPAPVMAAIAHHANPEGAGTGQRDAAIAGVAGLLATHMTANQASGSDAPLDDVTAENKAFAILNLYRSEIAQVLARTDAVKRLALSLTV